MAINYVVRKKIFKQEGESRQLWYAVQKKFQKRGGKTEEDLAYYISQRSTFRPGEVLGILTELSQAIEHYLDMGNSVSIKGLGSFQTAITSKGFEKPEEVKPKEVEFSRVYFIPDRKLTEKLKKMKFIPIPLSSYFPDHLLTPGIQKEEEE